MINSPLLPTSMSHRRINKQTWSHCLIGMWICILVLICYVIMMCMVEYLFRTEVNSPITIKNDLPKIKPYLACPVIVEINPEIILPISSIRSSEKIYQHHVEFTNVCYQDSMIYMMDNTVEEQNIQNTEYWDKLDPFWPIHHEYVKSKEFLQQQYTKLNGSTFMYTLAVDNIAQFYQEMACHLPVLLNSEYQYNTTGNSELKFDEFFTPHMNIIYADNATYQSDWCDSQLKWVVETMEEKKSTKINIRDQKWYEGLPSKLMCFEKLTIYQAGSCNGLSGPYPPRTDKVYADLRSHIFDKYHLRKQSACVSTVLVYDRSNASRRRLLNGVNITNYFRKQISEGGYKANVIQISDIPSRIFEQMQLYNVADLVIEPHSASNYNAMFQTDNAIHYEIGQHGSWFELGISPYLPMNYTRFTYGWDLIPYDPKVDNQEFLGERSFYIQQQLIEDMWSESKHRFCR